MKLLCNLLRNHKTEPYPVDVQLLRVLDETKELKKLTMVLFRYSNPRVYHRYLQKLVMQVIFKYFNNCLNFSLLSEFDSV